MVVTGFFAQWLLRPQSNRLNKLRVVVRFAPPIMWTNTGQISQYTECLLNNTQLIPGKIKLILLVFYTYLIHVGTWIRILNCQKFSLQDALQPSPFVFKFQFL